jgi:hypothetical protein
MKEKPVLNNKDEYPDNRIIRKVLKDNFILYEELINSLTTTPHDLNYEWRYYNDGKSWLCKVLNKKRTILWLSIFEGYFKVAFYFSAKTSAGINDLEIDENIKSDFEKADFIGRVKPLVINVLDKENIQDILKIANYKKKN